MILKITITASERTKPIGLLIGKYEADFRETAPREFSFEVDIEEIFIGHSSKIVRLRHDAQATTRLALGAMPTARALRLNSRP